MTMLRTLSPARALLCAFAVSALSCSVLVDTKTTQCDIDFDCTNLGAAFAKSTCQAHVCVAPISNGPLGCTEAEPSTEKTVKLSFHISLTIPPEVKHPFVVKACGPLDPDCTGPVAGPIEVPFPDGAMVADATVDVPVGFQGSLQLISPDALPAQEFLGRPIVQDTQGYDLIIPAPLTVKFLLMATSQAYNPDQGIFVITTRDCSRQPLGGVVVTNSEGGTTFYFQMQSPQRSLMATTSEGAAGFVNVPAGLVSVAATLNGRQMTGTSAISRGGWVTYVEIFP